MNFKVTCKFSGFAQRGLASACRSSPTNDASRSRKCEEIGSATNSRISAANGRCLAVVEEMKANHVKRGLCSLHTNHVAISDEADRTLAHACWTRDGQVDGANRLFLRATARSRDSRDAHSER